MSHRIHIEDVEIDGNRRTHTKLFDRVLQHAYKARTLKSLAGSLGKALEELKVNIYVFIID